MKTELLRLNQDSYTEIEVIRASEIKNIDIASVRVFDQTTQDDFLHDGYSESTTDTQAKGSSLLLINDEFVINTTVIFHYAKIEGREVNTQELIDAVLQMNS